MMMKVLLHLSNGAQVVVVTAMKLETLEEVLVQLLQEDVQYREDLYLHQLDPSDSVQIRVMIKKLSKRFRRIDVLINNSRKRALWDDLATERVDYPPDELNENGVPFVLVEKAITPIVPKG